MPGAFRSKLTFANVTSVVALFIALGGTTYAVTQLDGSKIVNRSIAGGKLEKNTLTGGEINESKLKKVKSAEVADRTLQLTVSAPKRKSKTADRALRGAGDPDSSLLKLSNGQSQQLLASGPFTLSASCVDTGDTPRIRVVATTTEPGTYAVGSGRIQPFGPGEEVTLVSVDDPIVQGSLGAAGLGSTYVAPSGATMQLGGGVVFGTQTLGADCVASAYGVG